MTNLFSCLWFHLFFLLFHIDLSEKINCFSCKILKIFSENYLNCCQNQTIRSWYIDDTHFMWWWYVGGYFLVLHNTGYVGLSFCFVKVFTILIPNPTYQNYLFVIKFAYNIGHIEQWILCKQFQINFEKQIILPSIFDSIWKKETCKISNCLTWLRWY